MNEIEAIRAAHKLGPRKYNYSISFGGMIEIYHNEVAILLKRIDELEASNQNMASRLIGHWLAPNEPDEQMCRIGYDVFCTGDETTIDKVYMAMRENYLARSE